MSTIRKAGEQRRQQIIENTKESFPQMPKEIDQNDLDLLRQQNQLLKSQLNGHKIDLDDLRTKLKQASSIKTKIQQQHSNKLRALSDTINDYEQKLKDQLIQKELLKLNLQNTLRALNDIKNAQEQKLKDQQMQKEFLQLHLQLKKDTYDSQLTLKHQQEKQQLNKKILQIQNKLSSVQSEFKLSKLAYTQLLEQSRKVKEKLKDSQQNCTEAYSQMKKLQQDYQQKKEKFAGQLQEYKQELQKSTQIQWQTKLQSMERNVKDIQSQANREKKALQDQIFQWKRKIQILQDERDKINRNLNNATDIVRTQSAEIKQLKQKLQNISDSREQEINKAIQQLQLNHCSATNQIYTHIDESIADKIKIIQKTYMQELNKTREDHQKQLNNKKQQYDQKINSIQQQVKKKVKLAEQLKQQSKSQIIHLQIDYKHKITYIQDLLEKITNLVLNQSYKDIDSSIFLNNIQIKIAQFNSLTQNLQQKVNSLQNQKRSLEIQMSQVNQWFISMNVLINSTSADQALERKRQYGISDTNLLTSINTFTSKLKQRLKEHKVKQQRLNDQIASLRTQKGELQEILADFTQQNQTLGASLKEITTQKDRLEKDINQISVKNQRLNKELQKQKKLAAQKQGENMSLTQEIKVLQTVKIPAFTQKISLEMSKADQLMAKQQKYQADLKTLEQCKLAVQKQLKNQQAQNEKRLKRIEEVKKQLIAKELQWKSINQMQLNKLRQIINQLFQSPPVENNFQSLLQYLKNNKPTQSAPLTVSAILQYAPKERKILEGHIYKLLECRSFTSKLLYKYDEFNKNFSNYIPTRDAYDFVFMVKSTKGQIFGVICCGLGGRSKAAAFNLTSGKLFLGQTQANSYKYDAGYLNFGEGELRFRSGSNLQITVNTRIFGSRYFTFTKQELVGSDNGQQLQLEAMQIHRINH